MNVRLPQSHNITHILRETWITHPWSELTMRRLSQLELRQFPQLFEIFVENNSPHVQFAFCAPSHRSQRLFDHNNRQRIASFSFTVYQFLKLKHRLISSTS